MHSDRVAAMRILPYAFGDMSRRARKLQVFAVF
jgi:hypothetical protein